MIVRRLVPKSVLQSQTFRAIAVGVLATLVVSAVTILISRLLGFPTHPGVAAALGTIAGASYLANQQQK